ncbi:MAG: hypothetical protein ACLSF4_03325 [Hominenteromicrobium sp.]|uniref:hypothetical protein n=1 Tax=Hominenteromicrobium sp. TaxID=3073581 RepID=UPI003994E306
MAESTKCQRYLTGNGSRCTGIIDKIGEMAALLQNAETIIGYNGKHFDIPFLECYGIRFRPDAMVSDPMLDGAVVYERAAHEQWRTINL